MTNTKRADMVSTCRPVFLKFSWFSVHFVLAVLSIVFIVTTGMSLERGRRLSRFIDFTTYYSAIRLVLSQPSSQLYNLETQRKVQEATLSRENAPGFVLPYIHPPFELLILLPLGHLPYTEALLCWLSVNLVSIIFLPMVLRGLCSNIWEKRKWTLALTAYSFFPFYFCLWQGQDSILFLWVLVAAYVLMKRRAEFLAGLMFGLAFMKFQIAYLLIAPLILKRRTKALLGSAVSLIFLAMVSVWWIGLSGVRDYFSLLLTMGGLHGEHNEMGLFPEKFQSWSGQLHLLGFNAHTPTAAVLTGCLGLCLVIILSLGKKVYSGEKEDLRLAGTILVAILASPYLYYHDLSAVFLPVILCLKVWLSARTINMSASALGAFLAVSPAIWISPMLYFWDVPVMPSVLWMTLLLVLLLTMIHSRQPVALT